MRDKRQIRAILAFILLTPLPFLKGSGISQDDAISQWRKAITQFPPSKQATELSFLYSFAPTEKQNSEDYFWSPYQLLIDKNGDMFVIDMKWKCIFKLNSEGKIVKKVGRQGQGPGDFMNPYCSCLNDAYVFVSDTMKRDIQLFDKDLNLVKSIKTIKPYAGIAISRDGLIIAAPFRMSPDTPMIDVLDATGNILRSFGKSTFGNDRNWNVPNFFYLCVDGQDCIYQAFKHFPLVCKYDIEGNLLAKYEFDNKAMLNAKKLNEKGMADPSNRIYYVAIAGLHGMENGFLILLKWPFPSIIEFDREGKQRGEYWAVRSYDYDIQDFAIKHDTAYFLIQNPVPSVEAFRVKR